MTPLNQYMQDGAHYQARAVLAFLQRDDGIAESWDDEHRRYLAEPRVSRWENCREQGYVITLRSKNYQCQLNIAWFEHRNSDNICAVKWEQNTLNSPTIATAEFSGVYETKWDVSYTVGYGEVVKMADWIWEQLIDFWRETHKEGK